MSKRRGLAMASILLMVFMLLLFGMTLASLASSQYRLTSGSARRTQSLHAAQSGLALASYWMARNPSWGTTGESLDERVGEERFELGFSATADRPASVNNLESSSSRSAPNGRVVPPYTALLYVRGEDAQGTKPVVLEALARFASFPYAVAAGQEVRAQAGLTVLGAPDLTAVLAGEAELPGHVYGGERVVCGGGSTVSGKVRSVGTVSLSGTALGGVEENVNPELLPNLDLTDYSTRDMDDVTVMVPGAPYLAPVLSGPVYVDGDLELVSPVLVNARLYVRGNLSVLVSMVGTGSIFVEGSTRLAATTTLLASDSIAVFSQGPLEVVGGAAFQGVLYSHQDVRIQTPLTVVGSVMSRAGNVHFQSPTIVTYLSEFTRLGTSWARRSMLGSVLAGSKPRLELVYWREL